MSYTKTVWQAHDIITAEKMQKIENQLETLSSASTNDALPTVSSTDNGKVLKVVEGQWAKADASGGGALLVETEYDSASHIFTATTSADDVFAAFTAGQPVIIRFYLEGYTNEVNMLAQMNLLEEHADGKNHYMWSLAYESGYITSIHTDNTALKFSLYID